MASNDENQSAINSTIHNKDPSVINSDKLSAQEHLESAQPRFHHPQSSIHSSLPLTHSTIPNNEVLQSGSIVPSSPGALYSLRMVPNNQIPLNSNNATHPGALKSVNYQPGLASFQTIPINYVPKRVMSRHDLFNRYVNLTKQDKSIIDRPFRNLMILCTSAHIFTLFGVFFSNRYRNFLMGAGKIQVPLAVLFGVANFYVFNYYTMHFYRSSFEEMYKDIDDVGLETIIESLEAARIKIR